jgi:hypothetical protein
MHARVHDREFFNMMNDRPKNCRMGVQRLPTAYLLPIVARTENSALPLNGQLSDKIHHSLWPRKSYDRPEQFGHVVARQALLRLSPETQKKVEMRGHSLWLSAPPGRVHRAVPSGKNHDTAVRRAGPISNIRSYLARLFAYTVLLVFGAVTLAWWGFWRG